MNSKFEHEVKTNTDAASKTFVSKFEYIYIPRNMKRQVTLPYLVLSAKVCNSVFDSL